MTDEAKAAFKAFELDGWETVASNYAAITESTNPALTAAVLDAAGAGSGVRLLDVATGPGWIAGGAVARGAEAVGVDFAAAMVMEARQRFPGIEFHQGSAEQLPFDDASFDVVTSSLGMPHFADHDAFMSEAARVLRPGGRLVFASWAQPANNPLFGVVFAALARHGSLDVDLPQGVDMFTWDDMRVCQEYLDRAGFGPAQRSEVSMTTRFDNPAGVMQLLESGGVRSRALLLAQTAEARAAIAGELETLMAPHKSGDHWEIEGRAFVVAAERL